MTRTCILVLGRKELALVIQVELEFSEVLGSRLETKGSMLCGWVTEPCHFSNQGS